MTKSASIIQFHPPKLVLLASFIICLILILGILNPFYHYLALSACILGILIIPLWKLQVDIFSVWYLLFIGAFFEIFLRSLYITFDIPDKDRIQQVFLLNETKDFLLNPYLLVICASFALTLGFMVKTHKSGKFNIKNIKQDEWDMKRFWYIVSALLILSWIGMYLIFQGGMETFLKQRGASSNLEDYKSYTYARLLVSFSYLAGCIIFVKMLNSVRIKIFDLFIFIVSLVTFLLYSFWSGTRSWFSITLFTMAIIYYYTNNKKIPFIPIIFLGYISLVIISYMTYLRSGISFEDVGSQGFNLLGLIEPAILTTNGFDISKTGHIMQAVPDLLDFQYGKTLIMVIFLWIPRSIWTEKPVGVDTTIGMKIFGSDIYGAGAVPPGFIAEMYLNFWIPGVIIGCFILGLLIRRIHDYFKNNLNNRNNILLYVICFMSLGSSFIGSGVSNAMVGFLMNFIPMYVILHIITKKHPNNNAFKMGKSVAVMSN